ncbi:MAG: hypothetical protein ACOCSO_00275 [Thermoplasmatota archaeon]
MSARNMMICISPERSSTLNSSTPRDPSNPAKTPSMIWVMFFLMVAYPIRRVLYLLLLLPGYLSGQVIVILAH